MSESKVNTETNIPTEKKKSPWRWLWYLLLIIILLPILIGLLVQIPKVQNFLVDKVTSRLSETLNAQVDIEEIHFSITKGVVMDNFLVVDMNKDTLINSGHVSLSLAQNLFSYFNDQIDLDEILIENASIRIIRYADHPKSNLSTLLDKLVLSNDDNKKKSSLKINVNDINLNNVKFISNDLLKGELYSFEIPKGRIEVNSLENGIILDDVFLDRPHIIIEKNQQGDLSLIADKEVKDQVKQQLEIEQKDTVRMSLSQFTITDGMFSYHDHRKEKSAKREMDYHYFDLSSFNLNLKDLHYLEGFDIHARLHSLSFVDQNGFRVKEIKSETIEITTKKIILDGFLLETDETSIKDHLEFKFRSFDAFKDLANNVIFQVDLDKSRVAYADLMYLIPQLNESSIFIKNKGSKAQISGNYFGKINNLSGNNIDIQVGESTKLKGAFSSRNITTPDKTLLNLTVKDISTSVEDLKTIIPGFNPPANFLKLGKLKYRGRFDGFLNDFVSLGNLTTDLGNAQLDMRLDLKEGRDNARYSGEMALKQFNLAEWSDNPDFDFIDFQATVKEGYGLTLDNASADLDALINTVGFKGYQYKNLLMDGKVDKNNFTGEFIIADEEVNFSFNGGIKIIDGVPDLDFQAKVNHIDLDKINLVSGVSNVSGNIVIKANGSNLGNIKGESSIVNLSITKNDSIYTMDSIHVESYLVDDSNRKVAIFSDIIEGSLKGKFNLTSIVNDVKRIIKQNYPSYTQNLNIKDEPQNIQNLVYDVKFKKSDPFYHLIGLPDFEVENLNITGELDNNLETIVAHIVIPRVGVNNNIITNSTLDLLTMKGVASVDISLDTSFVSGIQVQPIKFSGTVDKEVALLNLSTENILDSLQKIDISARLVPHPKGFEFNLSNKEWIMFGDNWTFTEGNKVVIGKNYLDIESLQLTDGYRFISVKNVYNDGIYLSMNNFNFLKINGIIDYDKMDFAGEGDVELKVTNIFGKPNLDLSLTVPEFTVNSDPFGSLKIEARKNDSSPLKFSVSLGEGKFQIGVDGSYDIDNDVLDGNLTATELKLDLMEYIIDTGISSTHGTVDIDVILSGSSKAPKFAGRMFMRNCGSTVDYLGVHYIAQDMWVPVTDMYIDLDGGVLVDPEGNTGIIRGGLKHNFIKDFRMFLDMSSEDIIVMNTSKSDNPLYYGFGKGKMDVSFRGGFSTTDMVVNCTTGPRTQLNIPVDYGFVNYEESFIEFINREDIQQDAEERLNEFKIEGLDIVMNLTLTNDAKMNIIFNEKLKDIITARGNGNIQVEVKRSGEFNVYGDYIIDQGEYLFTAISFVNKPFKVNRGSSIRWTGDPIDADLNIRASYENVRTNLTVFLSEYLLTASQEVKNQAARNTDVNLYLDVTGSLYTPIINFDLDFPNIDPGELKSFVDIKVRTLRASPNLMNDQVTGLILVKTFLPYNNPLGSSLINGGSLIQSSNSTLSEFLSQQFSQILSGFVNAALPENEIISSVDLEIGLNQNIDITSDQQAGIFDFINPDEIQLRLNPRFKFLGERLSARVGGNYVRNSTSVLVPKDSFIPDVSVEYDLSTDGKLKLRFTYIYDFDQQDFSGAQNRRQRYGLGVSYRKEFGKVIDLEGAIQNAIKEAVKDQL